MTITKEDILNAVEQLTVMELNELVKAFEEKFGVSAAAVAVAGPATVGAAAEAKTEFDVILASAGDQKEGVSQAEADDIKKQLEEAGAKVEIK